MFFFKKKKEEISRTEPGYEEMERRTPRTGVILLLIMFVAGLYFGWVAVNDIQRIPKEPPRLSSCSNQYGGRNLLYESYNYRSYSYDYYGNADRSVCNFNDIETSHGIPSLIEKKKEPARQLEVNNNELVKVNSSLNSIRKQIDQLTKEYGVGLEEREEGITDPLFSITPYQQQINQLRSQETNLQSQKQTLERQISVLDEQIKVLDGTLKEAYKPVFDEHNKRLRWFEFKVFLLQIFFILPLFLLVFWGYLRLHKKNSPYTIIFTAMVAVAGVLLLKVILVWCWGLFLARVLEVILAWIRRSELLRTILFYSGMLFSFVIFGGAVYLLQKKVFDPRRVTLRRYRDNKCPRCQTSLDLAQYFCPNCGHQIKEKCSSCQGARFSELPNCPYCGNKK